MCGWKDGNLDMEVRKFIKIATPLKNTYDQ
jgi:hypothetical protein